MIAGNKLHDAFLSSVILPTITFSNFHIGGAGMTRLVSDNNSLAVFVTQDSCNNGLQFSLNVIDATCLTARLSDFQVTL